MIVTGNHDNASSIWLREMFKHVYEANSRIEVHGEQGVYYAIKHGKCFIGVNHEHCARGDKLETVFADKYLKMFGETEFGYIHIGHFHNRQVKEGNMFIVEMHQTLTSKDDYSASGGYFAGRSASVITYHKSYGEVGRVTIPFEMLKDLHVKDYQ